MIHSTGVRRSKILMITQLKWFFFRSDRIDHFSVDWQLIQSSHGTIFWFGIFIFAEIICVTFDKCVSSFVIVIVVFVKAP